MLKHATKLSTGVDGVKGNRENMKAQDKVNFILISSFSSHLFTFF